MLHAGEVIVDQVPAVTDVPPAVTPGAEFDGKLAVGHFVELHQLRHVAAPEALHRSPAPRNDDTVVGNDVYRIKGNRVHPRLRSSCLHDPDGEGIVDRSGPRGDFRAGDPGRMIGEARVGFPDGDVAGPEDAVQLDGVAGDAAMGNVKESVAEGHGEVRAVEAAASQRVVAGYADGLSELPN